MITDGENRVVEEIVEVPSKPLILCIEGAAGLARLLQTVFQNIGYTVDITTSGRDRLRMLDRKDYDILPVEHCMPQLGGLDIIRDLDRQGKLIPTIMITGHGNENAAMEAMKLGACDYIVKDLEHEYLKLLPLVTEQALQKRQIMRDMQEAEERYCQIVDLSQDGICICDDGTFVFMNPAGVLLFGAVAVEELLGNPVIGYICPDYRKTFSDRLKQVQTERSVGMAWTDGRIIRLDGETLSVEVGAVPFVYGNRQMVQVIMRDITDRKVAEQRLEFLAHYDVLTGLPNRILFYDRLNRALAAAKLRRSQLALLFVNIDRFRAVNDTLGHDVGDLLLREVALRLTECVRKSDSVARIGGDEFTVLITKVSGARDVALVAEKILAAVREPFTVRGHDRFIGASLGICLHPSDGEDTNSLLAAVDTAMCRAKENGRNNYQFVA